MGIPLGFCADRMVEKVLMTMVLAGGPGVWLGGRRADEHSAARGSGSGSDLAAAAKEERLSHHGAPRLAHRPRSSGTPARREIHPKR
ncbi:hypothetical protein NOK12_26120 [Nocardioides sp. OK12]|nr:hypothetical protein NOK12_26120 [Nocardioides sp. OK12]